MKREVAPVRLQGEVQSDRELVILDIRLDRDVIVDEDLDDRRREGVVVSLQRHDDNRSVTDRACHARVTTTNGTPGLPLHLQGGPVGPPYRSVVSQHIGGDDFGAEWQQEGIMGNGGGDRRLGRR